MRYRRFGRTELAMPVFSCGGMRYQQSWKDVDWPEISVESQANLEATLARSLELGINHIETARYYGSSERQLGKALAAHPRSEIILQTKVPPSEDPAEFLETFDRSMSLLQTDYVDLLSIHGVNNAELLDWALRKGGSLEVAERLQAEGRVRHIGFSTHAPLPVILEAIASDRFSYINLHWYYIFQTNQAALEAAQKHDMGVFIISPSDKGGHLYSPPQKLVDLCEPLHPMVFNDLFCLSQPQIHTLSIGAARPSDFDRHLETLPLLDQADQVLPPILERLEAAATAALGQDWLDTWMVGLPTPDTTPGEINIPTIVWLHNLVQAFDMVKYAKARYNLLGNGGHWFPGQRAGQFDPVALSAALDQSPHRDRILQILKEMDAWLGGESVVRLSQSS
ncbi:aldo/keto reductase [Synechococcus elongatus]|uniref:aldo/keto reductase n=1 Tax=Synechococcus elongatus TaxID=32046 RepID=UPI000F7F790C|nr:aldo/keto reductase [Synechococcus elongatus]